MTTPELSMSRTTHYANLLKAFASSPSLFRLLHSVPAPYTTPPKTLYILDSSFNPPTLAHLHIARSAVLSDPRAKEGEKRILLLLATQNADKAPKPAGVQTFVLERLRELASCEATRDSHTSGLFEDIQAGSIDLLPLSIAPTPVIPDLDTPLVANIKKNTTTNDDGFHDGTLQNLQAQSEFAWSLKEEDNRIATQLERDSEAATRFANEWNMNEDENMQREISRLPLFENQALEQIRYGEEFARESQKFEEEQAAQFQTDRAATELVQAQWEEEERTYFEQRRAFAKESGRTDEEIEARIQANILAARTRAQDEEALIEVEMTSELGRKKKIEREEARRRDEQVRAQAEEVRREVVRIAEAERTTKIKREARVLEEARRQAARVTEIEKSWVQEEMRIETRRGDKVQRRATVEGEDNERENAQRLSTQVDCIISAFENALKSHQEL
ncbi:hypothetical protein B7494_g8476 [Chlorociboria aeruginascens]|nr:hypothetical protein B7494_g8476 [Chlorociboria aeruginascens]